MGHLRDAYTPTIQLSRGFAQISTAGEVAENDSFDRNDYPSANHVQGQVVCVPAHSHIYHKKVSPNLLTITLNIRNTGLDEQITGKLIP